MCCGPGHPRTLEGTPTDLASSQGSPEMGPEDTGLQKPPLAPRRLGLGSVAEVGDGRRRGRCGHLHLGPKCSGVGSTGDMGCTL